MATRQIKSVKELPDWFCIDNYKEAVTMDARSWYLQLSTRSLCRDQFSRHPGRQCRELGHKILSLARGFPFHGKWQLRAAEYHKKDRELNPFNTYSVESLSRGTLGLIFNEIDESEKLLYEVLDCEDLTSEQELALQESSDLHFLRRGIDIEGYANVVVNLTATDEQLLSDFKHWLAGFRQASGHPAPTNNFTHKQFARWHGIGVLPYLDLLLWSMVEEVSITDHVMGRAIFPDEYDVDLAERIAKTTRKAAMEAIAEPTIAALHAQAVAERLAEQNFQKTLPE